MLCTRHPAADPPAAADLDDVAGSGRRPPWTGWSPPAAGLALAVGGTATSLHRLTGPRLTETSLGRALERLCSRPAEEAAVDLDLDPERARLMPAGIAVLSAVAARLGTELRAARGGLREGAVLELAGPTGVVA